MPLLASERESSMAGFSKVSIIGWLSRDPETDYTPNGALRIKFSIPVSRRYNDRNGQEQENTAWYNISMVGPRADSLMKLIEMGALTKGKQAYVEGRLEPREWTDKEGKNRTSLDVYATEVQLLGSRGDAPGGGGGSRGGSGSEADFPVGNGGDDVDNVPF